jgi:hypothetical protein
VGELWFGSEERMRAVVGMLLLRLRRGLTLAGVRLLRWGEYRRNAG